MSVGRSAIRCGSAELCLRLRALQRVAQLGDALLRSGCGLGLGGLLFVVDAQELLRATGSETADQCIGMVRTKREV